MPSAGPDPLPRRRSHDELLAHVYAEGARRRRRRRLGRVGALAAVVAMAAAGGAVASLLPGQAPPQNVAARGAAAPAGPGPSTTATVAEPFGTPADGGARTTPAAPSPATTVAPPAGSGAGAGVAAGGGGRPTPPTPEPSPPPAETTEPAASTVPSGGSGGTVNTTGSGSALRAAESPEGCRNSTDPSCGPFRWDPDPGPNAPLTVTVTAAGHPGDPRTFVFTVVYRDPDAPIREGCRRSDFGDGGTAAASGCAIAACVPTYGPWDPPPREPGYDEAVVTHTFPGPGTYVVHFSATSGGACGHPYASAGSGSIEVVVPPSPPAGS